jgi:hypothetical protein
MRLRETMPPGAVLLVTADHGMVDVAPAGRVDIDTSPDMSAGLRLLAGESRFRHLYAVDGAVPDVLAAYRARLGANALVLTRDDAIERGWFGVVEERVAPRIGDVVVASLGPVALVASVRFPQEAGLVGLHGSLTAAEMAIPLLVDPA